MDNNNNDFFLRSWFALADGSPAPDNALAVPQDLSDCIMSGQHPLDIWMSHENMTLKSFALMLRMPYEKLLQQSRSIEPYYALNGEDVLVFCMRRGVHPAHLVPFDDNPQFSLPRCILEANILVAKDKAETLRNRQLAEQAIACELKRYSRFLKYGNQGTGLSYMFAQAIAAGYYEDVHRQLEAHFHDKRREALNIAPLLLERLSVDKQKELDKLLGRQENLEAELELADDELDKAYEAVFGFVPTGQYEIVTAYASMLRDRYPQKMTDKQLSRNAYGVGTMNGVIYDMIAEDVTRLAGPYFDDPLTALNVAIHALADSVRAYWQAQAKLDLFRDAHGDKIEALELVNGYISQCSALVSGSEGDVIRRLFVNYGVIKTRDERDKSRATVCALLQPPAAE